MTRSVRKPRLFAFPREVELQWIEGLVHDPAERKRIEDVVDAFALVATTRTLTRAALDTIGDASTTASAEVRGTALNRLAVLTHYFPEAMRTMRKVAMHQDPKVRIAAAAACSNTPEHFAAPMLASLLRDPEWLVRKAAANVGGAVQLPSLVDTLVQRTQDETDARVRVRLQLALDFQERARNRQRT
jgi:hypothetical protein